MQNVEIKRDRSCNTRTCKILRPYKDEDRIEGHKLQDPVCAENAIHAYKPWRWTVVGTVSKQL